MSRRLAATTAAVVLSSAFLTGAGAATGFGAPATASAATGLGASASAPARSPGGTWGTAAQIPGFASLDKGDAVMGSVSCANSTTCSAGGAVTTAVTSQNNPFEQAFVVNRKAGVWKNAQVAPGIATLNAGGNAKITSVSCAAAGNCSAGGYYTDAAGHAQGFVIGETNGGWHNAEEVPGLAALNSNPAALWSMSCAAVGDCSAGGFYTDAAGHVQAFVVNETGGTWGNAEEVPGTAALNAGGYAKVYSVSCGAVGDCVAGGIYASKSVDGIPVAQAFVATETNGTWGSAQEVPGTAALNGGGYATVDSVSCNTAGNCSAGGEYTTSAATTQAYVVSETNGTWGGAQEVPGTAALNTSGLAEVNSVSCVTPGNCSAGGYYTDTSFSQQAFVVNQTNGTWGSAEELPGFASLDTGLGGGAVATVSCAAVGFCSAGGSYTDSASHKQAFVANETSGSWGNAEEVPGTGALNVGGQAGTQSISCALGGTCTLVGQHADINQETQVFGASETSG
ncbi:MAG TPA: hypothetical protein VGS19_09805 [Streptosporangiaceae bacterium]|nr:hypothetical protein [Streptosporangiaceae bacterium]